MTTPAVTQTVLAVTSRPVKAFVSLSQVMRIKILASGLVKGQATVAHFSSFFLVSPDQHPTRPTQRTAAP